MRAITMSSPLRGHAAPITHVAFRGDGGRLATSSYDGSVIVWDSSDPRMLRQLVRLPHRRLVNGSAWHPARRDILATASADKTVLIWRIGDGNATVLCALARHTDDINSVGWLPGDRLVCVSEDGRATLWEALTGRFLGAPVTHASHCMMVATNQDGLIATVGEDGKVAVVAPDSVSEATQRSYKSSVEGCAWSHRGDLLALARDDGAVDVLRQDLSTVVSTPVSSSAARSVAWSPDDSTLVVGAYDGAVHFLTADGSVIGRFTDHRMWPRSVTTAPGVVAVGSFWSTPHLLDFSGRQIAGPAEPTHGPNAMAARSGELLVGCDSGTVLAVDMSSVSGAGPPACRSLPITAGPIMSLDAASGDLVAGTYSGHLARAGSEAAFSPNLGAPVPSALRVGSMAVGGTYNGEMVAVDERSLTVVHRGQPHEGSIKSMAVLRGDAFVSCATDRVVALGGLVQRTPLWEHGNLVNSVATLGGAVVASGSRDHTVKVGRVLRDGRGHWRADECATLLGPDESVKCVALLGTADAPVVLAGSYDFGLYAWQVAWGSGGTTARSGALVAEFGQALSCACRIDATTAAVAGWDGRIAIVRLRGGAVRVVANMYVADLIRNAGRWI